MNRNFSKDLLEGKGTFTVPIDYNHDTQIDVFAKKTNKLRTIYYFDGNLNSQNFAKSSNKLVPGKTYRIKLFSILEEASSGKCLCFLKANNAILVGGQGLTALQENQPSIFPDGKWVVSFDEKGSLWEDCLGYLGVPGAGRRSDGSWEFRLCCFEFSLTSTVVLVCFCDLD